MPPKRAASGAVPSAPAKRTKKSPKSSESPGPTAKPNEKNRRWAAVSGSANADADYKLLITKDPIKAYSYICLCSMPCQMGDSDDSDEDEWSDVDSDEQDAAAEVKESRPKIPCDGGRSCLCLKDAKEHPDHPWVFSLAAHRKFFTQRIQVSLRDPDHFEMYTWNDHAGQGVLEVLQNLILDFAEAEADWREQWAICEATVLFLLSDDTEPMMGIDDPDSVEGALRLVGRAILSILARFARENLLTENSEVWNLGRIMALYMKLAAQVRDQGFLEAGDNDRDGSETEEASANGSVDFSPANFDDYIVAYANKFGIPLYGPEDIDDIAAECDGTVRVPRATDHNDDPWRFKAALEKYQDLHGVEGKQRKATIGGDKLDITTWTAAERKSHSFNGRDPLGKKELDAIKKGMVMQLA